MPAHRRVYWTDIRAGGALKTVPGSAPQAGQRRNQNGTVPPGTAGKFWRRAAPRGLDMRLKVEA